MAWLARVSSVCALALCCATASRGERLPLPAELQAQVNEAVDRGIIFLFKTQGLWGSWTVDPKNHPVGYAALPGLTLLECGEPKDHPVVLLAASFVRQSCAKLDTTYDLSLAILLLDRLGEPGDEGLIQTLALRLIAGQSCTGGWTYRCPVLSTQHSQRLLAALRAKTVSSLPAYLKSLPVFGPPSRVLLGDPPGKTHDIRGITDNSNSQFAALALWAAQRHAVPMERTLMLIAVRFNTSQNSDGSWGYHYSYGGGDPERPAMTCAGLLGLAIGHGLAADKEANENPALVLNRAQAAATIAFHPQFSFLLLALERAERKQALDRAKRRGQDLKILNGFVALNKHVGEPTGRTEAIAQTNLYFMWSLERVGVLYDLPTIGHKDWYRWGAEMLVANQRAAGNWDHGGYPSADPIIDTCFALLFLKRANLVAELTNKLPFDPHALTSSINQQLGPSKHDQPLASTGLEKKSTIAPANTAAATSLATKMPNEADGSHAPHESSLPSDGAVTRGKRGWLWLLVAFALLLFIACGVLLASYSLSRHQKRERPRRVRQAKSRQGVPRPAKYLQR